jgi:glutamate dehydrogenase (NAD(P)+)
VAASDSRGSIINEKGLDVAALIDLKERGRTVSEFADGRKGDTDAIIDVECDIWIPAARPDVVRLENAHQLNTRIVLEGANIPVTLDAERALHERGVLCVPDFIANAGGVICAAMEYAGATQSAVFPAIEEKIRANVAAVLEAAERDGCLPRDAAVALAAGRVRQAMSTRRFNIM